MRGLEPVNGPSHVDDEVLLARAYLSRVAEPTCVPLWAAVRRAGPVAVAEAVRAGDVPDDLREATAGRANRIDPHADLEAADRRGIRLLVPEMSDWPHIAMAALESTALERLARYVAGDKTRALGGELVPPLALWTRGPAALASLSLRSAAIVGSRSSTSYGNEVAKDLAYRLALRDFDVVSGGAYGIDAAAHRGALAAAGRTFLVTAGGVDEPYPSGNRDLFARVARSGLILSESPPGAKPHRHRFLSRNRLIAALGTGTVVVEAAARSGAMNTAAHCRGLGRVLMAVPGPVSSTFSVGCHRLLSSEHAPARLVTRVEDVVAQIGGSSDLSFDDSSSGSSQEPPGGETAGASRSRAADALDPTTRQVLDGFPARATITLDRLIVTSGVPQSDTIRAIPMLQMHGLIEQDADGGYRLVNAPRARRS